MQNLIIYHLVSGQAWFSSGILFLAIIALDLRGCFERRAILRRFVRAALFLLMVFAALSGTPLPLWIAIPLVCLALAYAVAGFSNPAIKWRRRTGGGLIPLILIALAMELPWHFNTQFNGARPRTLCIFADSITAGMGGEKYTYPQKLASLSQMEIRDYSMAGATTESAVRQQLPRFLKENNSSALILIEIGGNDMVAGTNGDVFRENLERLFAACRPDAASSNTFVMFELPVLPGYWSYASAQRDVAAKYNAALIPKRVLAGLLLAEGNTIDGIHLLPQGHDRMAEILQAWLASHRR